jgi:hypothetical protein
MSPTPKKVVPDVAIFSPNYVVLIDPKNREDVMEKKGNI